ncbi:MAG: dihydrofolate reductase [Opitutaceae bacterium]
MRPFSLIVSCSENRIIGRAGRLPWSIPEDRRFFNVQTAGGIVVLGRVCFDTWPGALREGRRAVVVTSRPLATAKGLQAARSLPEALAAAEGLPGDIYVCGGQKIFEEAMPRPEARRLYLTLVHASVEGDRSFPDWRAAFPRELARRESADPNWRYTFFTLGRAEESRRPGARAP